jgi:hypothetical protein
MLRDSAGNSRQDADGRRRSRGRDARIMSDHRADKPGLPAVLAQRAWPVCGAVCGARRAACGIAGRAGLIKLRAWAIGGELSRAKSRMRSSQGNGASNRCERAGSARRTSGTRASRHELATRIKAHEPRPQGTLSAGWCERRSRWRFQRPSDASSTLAWHRIAGSETPD